MGPHVCCSHPAHWCMASELHISQAPLHMKGQVAVSGLKCYMRRSSCTQLQPYDCLADFVVEAVQPGHFYLHATHHLCCLRLHSREVHAAQCTQPSLR